MSRLTRRMRVLHSMPAPGAETRYATHMAAVQSEEFEMNFFTWRRAIFGSYDLFHLHWPEHLLGSERGVLHVAKSVAVRALLLSLRLRRVPVVYTLHNHRPHDRESSPLSELVYREFAGLVRVEIHLVPEPNRVTDAEIVPIPHADYREAFAMLSRENPDPGRLLTFGIIKRYKGIIELLDVFDDIDDADVSLRIAGEPADPLSVAAIETSAARNDRVSARFGFLSDRELVAEVTRAALVVLPYRELHSSGSALAALSLDRPVLLPEGPTAQALAEEVGAGWVHTFTPPLSAECILSALRAGIPAGRPSLASRSWRVVRRAHTVAYRRALTLTPCSRRRTIRDGVDSL